jgi:cytochrome c biogenesis protein CcdA
MILINNKMLYILLIIIAIGVLLASEAGKTFLGLLIKLALVVGGLYLGFWIVVIGIAFAGGISQFVVDILSLAFFVGIIIGGNYLIGIAINKKKRMEVWIKIKESYIKNKSSYIAWGIIFGTIILAIALPYLVEIYYRLFP